MSGLRDRLMRLKSAGHLKNAEQETRDERNDMDIETNKNEDVRQGLGEIKVEGRYNHFSDNEYRNKDDRDVETPIRYRKFIELESERKPSEQEVAQNHDHVDPAIEPANDAGAESLTGELSQLPVGWRLLGAHLVTNEWGSFILRRKVYPSTAFHGNYELSMLRSYVSSLEAFQKEGQVEVIATQEQLLFFDTETTGLGVGAGNVPFMIGMGYYEDDSFIMEQMFIRNASEERAMLHYFLERLKKCTHIVSYNGKTFDWPLVLSRLVMNRMASECPELQHIDLLHCSRSVWKHTLPTCKLSTVEEDRLGVHRHDDVPGSLAPILYFQYLAEGNPTILSGVFDHNELDVLSLAALSIHFAKLLDGVVLTSDVPTEERFRCALWLEKMGRTELAEERMDEILQEILLSCSENDRIWRGDVPVQMAAWYKKRGITKYAVALWQRLIDYSTDRFGTSVQPFVELAMHYEHRERNLVKALHYAQSGEQMLRKRKSLNRYSNVDSTPLSEMTHRIQRLKRKLGDEQQLSL
ncbi:ribonuclease H-like domain-containing protein [Paenibacillus sp. N1-5-1-14]|uniref:ribonuclease H-like domain-containing protein n=1 Tax=Paenibacillus radicibacter TaxID=2972488 RepID=UPI0021594D46|nr:ribonuclease H-like domain-containing protein [Paenibacillus radicibacter]MCR8641587.1 ribonuclease H-like domain-containing protein [Paenibacillus radicibacter]